MSSITERSNDLTVGLDVADPASMVRLFRQCDAQCFSGYQTYEGLLDEQPLRTIARLGVHIQQLFANATERNVGVVLSGSGTSGRLAYLCVRLWRAALPAQHRQSGLRYIIAGGDSALFTAREAVEDDCQAGVNTLLQACEGLSRVVFIGITCGLSAPFVAAQLTHCMDHPERFTPVLLGFNPPSLARRVIIQGLGVPFAHVAERMVALSSSDVPAFVVCPVVGPEPLTGSTRMKSGTATKIVLDVLFALATQSNGGVTSSSSDARVLVNAYADAYRAAYRPVEFLARVIELCGAALSRGGVLRYAGVGVAGIVGLVDASECVPTFGAAPSDVRGYVLGGYASLENDEGDMSARGDEYQLGLDALSVSDGDVLVGLVCAPTTSTEIEAQLGSLAERVAKNTPTVSRVLLVCGVEVAEQVRAQWDVVVEVPLVHESALLRDLCGLSALKWLLNVVSTGAHVLCGKVFGNRMIDVRISNGKLFTRAVRLVSLLTRTSDADAARALLTVLYSIDEWTEAHTRDVALTMDSDVDAEAQQVRIQEHVKQATPMQRVVPTAVLVALGWSLTDARATARDQLNVPVRPIVLRALESKFGQ